MQQQPKSFPFTIINPYNLDKDGKDGIPSGNYALNVTHLYTINRASILKYLISNKKIKAEMSDCNILTTDPRNYYFDILFQRNIEIFYEEDQVPPDQIKKIIKLPLHCEVIFYEKDFQIDCHNESFGMSFFNVIRKIGEGTYAQIYLVQRKFDKRLFCLKKISKSQCQKKGNLQMIKNQLQILQYPSKYKIKLYYAFEDARFAYFIIEYCVFGDLYSIIKSNRKSEQSQRMNITDKYLIWIQIAFGIVSLHQKGLIYRDLKPENILINQNGEVKICDFGLTCKIQPNEKMKEICGSYQYLAPQVIRRQGYNKSIDIYCLGLLLYQLLVGSNPFEGITPQNLNEMKGKSINFEKKVFSNTVKDLLKKMLKENPLQRIGCQQKQTLDLFKHPFFKENQDLVHKVINSKISIKNLRYIQPAIYMDRQESTDKTAYIFPYGRSYNYLKPFFDVTQNVGPKLNFNK